MCIDLATSLNFECLPQFYLPRKIQQAEDEQAWSVRIRYSELAIWSFRCLNGVRAVDANGSRQISSFDRHFLSVFHKSPTTYTKINQSGLKNEIPFVLILLSSILFMISFYIIYKHHWQKETLFQISFLCFTSFYSITILKIQDTLKHTIESINNLIIFTKSLKIKNYKLYSKWTIK